MTEPISIPIGDLGDLGGGVLAKWRVEGMLPPALSRKLVAWDKRRQARGREPLARPLHLRTHSIHGFMLLRMLAALRGVRRFGARYQDE